MPVTYAALSASALRNPYAPARTHRRLLAAPFLAEAKIGLAKSLCSQERSLDLAGIMNCNTQANERPVDINPQRIQGFQQNFACFTHELRVSQ